MKKYSIDVDADVFEALQELATPLVDSPNSVLRRLLLDGRIRGSRVSSTNPHADALPSISEPIVMRSMQLASPADFSSSADMASQGPYASLGHERRAASGMSPRRFGKLLCAREFPGEMFERARRDRGAFRTMFESGERLLYFLNFNKPDATNLWYKVNATALRALRDADKPAHIVFANPADRVGWVIPLTELAAQYKETNAERLGDRDVDLNVDVRGDRLRELDWGIGEWRREV